MFKYHFIREPLHSHRSFPRRRFRLDPERRGKAGADVGVAVPEPDGGGDPAADGRERPGGERRRRARRNSLFMSIAAVAASWAKKAQIS